MINFCNRFASRHPDDTLMATRPRIVRTVPALRAAVRRFRRAGGKVALVPTMGALHAGHLTLVRHAKRRARHVIVSIFVNPAQFAPHEDLATYPRPFDADVSALAGTGASLVWAPTVDAMYPAGFATRVVPAGPATVGLEDRFRPHFFSGVTTVVSKLLIQSQPDYAMFGEKDYQQLKVVTRMAKDLDLPVKIVGVPTVREPDGLAQSSRNAYLSASDRAAAPVLHRVLKQCAEAIAGGGHLAQVLDEGGRAIEAAGFTLDYLEARDALTLEHIDSGTDAAVRLLVAARIGKTRLIDNIPV
jgi:pantoate--beta-alanine ligase